MTGVSREDRDDLRRWAERDPDIVFRAETTLRLLDALDEAEQRAQKVRDVATTLGRVMDDAEVIGERPVIDARVIHRAILRALDGD